MGFSKFFNIAFCFFRLLGSLLIHGIGTDDRAHFIREVARSNGIIARKLIQMLGTDPRLFPDERDRRILAEMSWDVDGDRGKSTIRLTDEEIESIGTWCTHLERAKCISSGCAARVFVAHLSETREPLALKIIRSDTEAEIKRDVQFMRFAWCSMAKPWFRRYKRAEYHLLLKLNIESRIDQIERELLQQCIVDDEVANLRYFLDKSKFMPFVTVPSVIAHCNGTGSQPKWILQTFIDGRPLHWISESRRFESTQIHEAAVNHLCDRIVRFYFRSTFMLSKGHGDLHKGNFLIMRNWIDRLKKLSCSDLQRVKEWLQRDEIPCFAVFDLGMVHEKTNEDLMDLDRVIQCMRSGAWIHFVVQIASMLVISDKRCFSQHTAASDEESSQSSSRSKESKESLYEDDFKETTHEAKEAEEKIRHILDLWMHVFHCVKSAVTSHRPSFGFFPELFRILSESPFVQPTNKFRFLETDMTNLYVTLKEIDTGFDAYTRLYELMANVTESKEAEKEICSSDSDSEDDDDDPVVHVRGPLVSGDENLILGTERGAATVFQLEDEVVYDRFKRVLARRFQ